MARITRAALHLSVEEVNAKVKGDPRPWCRQRWLIIYNALVDPRTAAEIAKHTGTTVAMVHQVISTYNRWGEAAVESPGKGGRRHQYLTLEGEQQFLAPFFTRAEQGKIATAGEIKRAFEAQIGARQSMKARSIASSNVMAGANSSRVPGIRKPTKRRKISLKKLRDHG